MVSLNPFYICEFLAFVTSVFTRETRPSIINKLCGQRKTSSTELAHTGTGANTHVRSPPPPPPSLAHSRARRHAHTHLFVLFVIFVCLLACFLLLFCFSKCTGAVLLNLFLSPFQTVFVHLQIVGNGMLDTFFFFKVTNVISLQFLRSVFFFFFSFLFFSCMLLGGRGGGGGFVVVVFSLPSSPLLVPPPPPPFFLFFFFLSSQHLWRSLW